MDWIKSWFPSWSCTRAYKKTSWNQTIMLVHHEFLELPIVREDNPLRTPIWHRKEGLIRWAKKFHWILTPKVPRPLFIKFHLELPFLLQSIKNLKIVLFTYHRILHYTSVRIFGIFFINFDHIYCKIFAFEVKKLVLLHLACLDF